MTTATAGQTVLRVGIDDAAPIPMQDGDPAAGTFRGYEVDLVEQLARRLNYRIEYRRAWWSLITEELTSGKLDLVCSAATVTEERQKEVNFSTPHLHLKLASVQRREATESINMEGSRYGVRRGTTAQEFLSKTLGRKPEMLSESNDELYKALAAGELDAVIDDSPIALHFAVAIPGLVYGGAYDGTDASYAMMVAKGNDALLLDVNTALFTLEEEGVLASLRERWFGARSLLVA